MPNQRKPKRSARPRIILVAESQEAADLYVASHLQDPDAYHVFLVGKTLPATVAGSEVRITPGMRKHPDRIDMVRTARQRVNQAEPGPDPGDDD